MKIKLVVIDLEVPPRAKRWALRLGIPLAILSVAGIAFAVPSLKQWATGDTLTAADLNNSFQAVSVPAGTIVAWGGAGDAASVPAGWVLCNGAAVGRTGAYANLFAAISISFGGGDGVATFNLPDLRGYFLRGLDATGAVDKDANRKLGSVEADAFASHVHTASHVHGGFTHGGGDLFTAFSDIDGDTLVALTSVATGAAGGAETRPRNVAVNYIIKL
jgi:microcystin-dependent protein